MPRRAARLLLVVGASAAWHVGCVELGEPQALLVAEQEQFRVEVQPVLTAECASVACHGRASRPLALFSPGSMRADPARSFLNEPLTSEELEANMRRLAALSVGTAARESVLLLKPLAQAAGGHKHAGGDVFGSREEPGYRALLEWLERLR